MKCTTGSSVFNDRVVLSPDLLGITVMCPMGSVCLHTDCWFSESTIKIQLSVLINVLSGHHPRNVICSCQLDIIEQLFIWRKTTITDELTDLTVTPSDNIVSS